MRVLAGAVIFLILLSGVGFYSNKVLSSQAQKLNDSLANLENQVATGNWKAARESLAVLEKQWADVQFHWDLIIEHHEMDNIDSSLSKLEKYLTTKSTALALGEISSIKHYLKHIPQKEAFNLENIF